MFIGEYWHTFDEKGRIAIPAKLRYSKVGEDEYWVVTKGFDRCLFLYPKHEWERIVKMINERLSFTKKEDRSFLRMFVSPATEQAVDRQGRIAISQSLREYAGIQKEVVTLGAVNRIEVWSEENWKSYKEENEKSFDLIGERLEDLGL
ncbi:MAG: division/cell wall cluster transcriptional repressor MraZ [Spirochaetota bacterium]|nr:MAG: division/cell wall cluster transcriptional repressor MraZ [Spirochaetota bacterium]